MPGFCPFCLRPSETIDNHFFWCENDCVRGINQMLNAYSAAMRESAAYLISVAERHAKNRRNGGETPS